MEWNQIEGNLQMIKGVIITTWGKLINNDLIIVNGKRYEMIGRLQERYCYPREMAQRQIDKFIFSTGENTY